MAKSDVPFFFHLLDDGKWHSIDDLAAELDCREEDILKAVLSFLSIVDFDDKTKSVRLRPEIIRLPPGEDKRECA